MKLADLHVHSNFSDGSDTVEVLVKNIKKSNINIFALTDHDTIYGCDKIKNLITDDILFIPSIELTSKIETVKCHILGYNCDSQNKTLNDLITKGKELRKLKRERRIEFLKKEWGIELTQEELEWLNSIRSVTKTHFGIILVKRGLAENNLKAMDKYFAGCSIPNSKFDGYESIDAINKSGGIPVWAHPLGGEGEAHSTPEKFYKDFEIVKKAGIKGLECYYSRYNSDEIEFLVNFANQNNLLISGGSDYHGANKQNIALGKLNQGNQPIDADKLTILKEIIQ